MRLLDVFNTVYTGDEFNSHAIGYITEGKEKKSVELSDWNDANRILYLGEESFYYGHLSEFFKASIPENPWSFLMGMVPYSKLFLTIPLHLRSTITL